MEPDRERRLGRNGADLRPAQRRRRIVGPDRSVIPKVIFFQLRAAAARTGGSAKGAFGDANRRSLRDAADGRTASRNGCGPPDAGACRVAPQKLEIAKSSDSKVSNTVTSFVI